MASLLIAPRLRYWMPRSNRHFCAFTDVGNHRGCSAHLRNRISYCAYRSLHGSGTPGVLLQPFISHFIFSSGHDKDTPVVCDSGEKPRKTFRIFVLGESAAMGDPDPAYGFSRYLEVMLRERFPSMKFEVINTGSVAINSHVLLPIAKGLANAASGFVHHLLGQQ